MFSRLFCFKQVKALENFSEKLYTSKIKREKNFGSRDFLGLCLIDKTASQSRSDDDDTNDGNCCEDFLQLRHSQVVKNRFCLLSAISLLFK